MKIRFKKLHHDAVVPAKAHATDAGFDLTAISVAYGDNGLVSYGTGLSVEIPLGYMGLVFPRSSVCKKDLALTNSVGVIDSGYRGEIMAKFRMTDMQADVYEKGDRIAQLVIVPYPEIEFEEADELSDSDRGMGGYGSTGN